MRNLVEYLVEDISCGDPTAWTYIWVSVWLAVMVLAGGGLLLVVGMAFLLALPYSLIPVGVVLAVAAFGWYTWYSKQPKRVRSKSRT